MNITHTILFSPVFLPLLSAAGILFIKSFCPTGIRRIAEYLGILIGMILPLFLVLTLYPILQNQGYIETTIGGYAKSIGIVYRFDGMSLLLIFLAAAITIPSWIFSRKEGPGHSYFTALMLIQNASIAAIGMTADLFNLFVCLELMGVTAYVLIATGKKANAAYASFSYLMLSSSAMVFFLLGTFGLYKLTGSLSYAGISRGLEAISGRNQYVTLFSLLLIIVPVLLRVAVMPLSLWLVDAHAKAPHAVSALLSGVLLKVPLFALLRVFTLSPLATQLALPVSYAGAATALIGVLLALSQSDAKQLLAYHSISQIGYIVSAWGLALHAGITTSIGALLLSASFFHAFSHAQFKALLFLTIGKATDAAGNRNVYTLRGANQALRNEGERIPLTMLCFLVGALSISALPPFNGYYSKILVTYTLKGSMHYTFLTLASAGTIASFIKLSRIFLPSKQPLMSAVSKEKKRFSVSTHLSFILLALSCLAVGLLSEQMILFITKLISPEEAQTYGSSFFFTQDNLIKTALTVLAGIVLFSFAVIKPGRHVLHFLEKRRGGFTDLFLGFSVALGALALIGW
ncbi:MAG: proton-conducting transporter membrane subunit [Sphaerochaetaceae bacterium]|nr:proton-conducting transporter membrane subunit [Sphaerochaetaceae bacterium]